MMFLRIMGAGQATLEGWEWRCYGGGHFPSLPPSLLETDVFLQAPADLEGKSWGFLVLFFVFFVFLLQGFSL